MPLRARAVTIHQSVPPIRRLPSPVRSFLVTVIGHLREEKDPMCTFRALRRLPLLTSLRVVHLGRAMDEAHERAACDAMASEPRYAWLGERSHRDALRWLARSHLMVISSRMEGGAHAVSEAIAAGVPVLASDIPGNRGLLGADYPGLFPVADEAALAALLERAQASPAWLDQLTQAVLKRRPLASPETERARILQLLASPEWPRRA
jgi:glycosyltransferase involved in cell wall biosynthesis